MKQEVFESLNQQLINMGADVAHFNDLINDYMVFWDIKTALQEDIEERGTVIPSETATGDIVIKVNPSVKECESINRQMLSILKQLNLNTDNVEGTDDEDEEM